MQRGKSLADKEKLHEDETLKTMLGVKKFPDQNAPGEWLRQIGWAEVKCGVGEEVVSQKTHHSRSGGDEKPSFRLVPFDRPE